MTVSTLERTGVLLDARTLLRPGHHSTPEHFLTGSPSTSPSAHTHYRHRLTILLFQCPFSTIPTDTFCDPFVGSLCNSAAERSDLKPVWKHCRKGVHESVLTLSHLQAVRTGLSYHAQYS